MELTKEYPIVKCEYELCKKEFLQNRKDKKYCCKNCLVYASMKRKRDLVRIKK